MTERASASAVAAQVHADPRRGVFAITGGGAMLLADLLATPGASATVLEAHVPYAKRALQDYLGTAPERSCSAATARALAMRSFVRARELGGDFGFAVTAALATVYQRRGEDRAHCAFQDAASTRCWHLPLTRQESRRRQEQRIADTGLSLLAFALRLGEEPQLDGASATAGAFEGLLTGERSHVSARRFSAVLPGAFNPLHHGHRAMRADAAQRLATDVGYELSIANVDKLPLDYIELSRRLAQFAEQDVVVTNAPTFLAKARALGGATFVVGVDTLARIAEPRYYGSTAARQRALAEIQALGCRFLVYGRCLQGTFKTAADLTLPAELAAMCSNVPESEFRVDASSTAIRHGEPQH